MASADEARNTQSDDSNDIHNQENVSARGAAARHAKQQVRHRASVACASCRDRRIRCVVPKGESECTQCKRAGTECVIKNDDERRRPISKAYMSSLSDRINLLESMLMDRGVVPPPAVHPPKTRQDVQSKQPGQDDIEPTANGQQQQHQLQQPPLLQQTPLLGSTPDLLSATPQAQSYFPTQLPNGQATLSSDGSPSRDDTSPPESAVDHNDDFNMHDSEHLDCSLSDPTGAAAAAAAAAVTAAAVNAASMATASVGSGSGILSHSHNGMHGGPAPGQHPAHSTILPAGGFKETSPFRNLDPKKEDIVQRLLSTKGNLSFDQLSGRFRFFGPTANSHVYAETADSMDAREPPEQVRRSERIIRSLTTATHDYLMDCFWDYYNAIIYVIDREAFEAAREAQNPKFYTSFLHITVLATGYRFADRSREDIKKISLGNRESTLQREAKYMLDIELERPGGIPSVQALLLLGDLECGVGRDNTGWMYSGMANRLAFDIGLHLDYSSTDMNEQEVNIRHMVMKAAIVIDKYWALFLGRPTSIKSQDIGMDLLTKRFSMMASFPDSLDGGSGAGARPARPAKMSNEEIYEYLFELMELAGKIVESRDMHKLGGTGTGGGGGGSNSSANSYATIMPFAGTGYGGGAMGSNGFGGSGISNGPSAGGSSDHSNVFALNESEENAYLHVISLDRQLQNWYRRLPDHLTWKPANIKAAPMSFFLLHQQYHVSMILLHRPWAKYGSILGGGSDGGSSTNSHPSPSSPSTQRRDSFNSQQHAGGISFQQQQQMYGGSTVNGYSNTVGGHALGLGDPQCIVDDSRTTLSRSICTQQAIRVARIFWQHRQRFDGRRICVTGIQHAGTAAIALIAALAYQQSSEADRRSYLGYLEILSYALTDMSHTYAPASRMDDLLKAVLEQMRSDVYGPEYAASAAGPIHTPLPTPTTANPIGSGAAAGGRPGSSISSSTYGNDLTGAHGWYGPATTAPNGSNNGIDVYSVLPARRENPDAEAAAQTAVKKRRPTNSRRASEFSRPPPPFFTQPTPPGSTAGGASGNVGLISTSGLPSTPSSAVGQHGSNGHMMANYFSSGNGTTDHAAPFNLDFLNGSAIDLDGPDDRPADGSGGVLRTSIDDYVLVPPGSDSWALNGSGGGHHHNNHPSHHHSHSHSGFDMPMADWMMGPVGAASAAANGAGGMTSRDSNAASISAVLDAERKAAAAGSARTGSGAAPMADWMTGPVGAAHAASSSLGTSEGATPRGTAAAIGAALEAERKAATSAAGTRTGGGGTPASGGGSGGPSPGDASTSDAKNGRTSLDGGVRLQNGNSATTSNGNSTKASVNKGGSSLDWLDADGPLDGLSPVSLSGLVVQTVEKTAGEASAAIVASDDDRNHDLDFFSF